VRCHLILKNDHFTKTGSGQTFKHREDDSDKKIVRFHAAAVGLLQPAAALLSQPLASSGYGKRVFLRHVYTTNDHFTKTGSGQT
jgi:hypothetical protein